MVNQAATLHQDLTNCIFLQNTHPDLRLFGDATFDLVYSNIALQHVPARHVPAYIRDFVRITRPGGTVVFQLPAERTAEYLQSETTYLWLRRSPLVPLGVSAHV
jgi:ubiquinone/menaquinone biosynthesis C-methylase UbiE